jgi:putative phosphoribosyl transferase
MPSPLTAIRAIDVPFRHDVLRVELGTPRDMAGLVFLVRDNGNVVHGNALAFSLRQNGFGTAVCHLLTQRERERATVQGKAPIHTALMALRLAAILDAVAEDPDMPAVPWAIAASAAAASAALLIAARRPLEFDAIVCRRPNMLIAPCLEYVRAATLFLAVAGDQSRIRPMMRAFQKLPGVKKFEVVPGASPAFRDDRSFGRACELTSKWLVKNLVLPTQEDFHVHAR